MNYIKLQIGLLIALLFLTGCDGFVEVATPSSQLTGNVVFEDRTTANAALVDLYAQLRDGGLLTGNGLGSGVCLGLYADELTYYGTNDDNVFNLYTNSLQANTSLVGQQWNSSYHQIYCANAIIEGCQKSSGLSEADKNSLWERLCLLGL